MPQPIRTENEISVSLYSGNLVTKDDISDQINQLSIAFPKMSKDFFVLLTKYIFKEKFTQERLKDAVDNVICKFQYKELNISDIISFDKRIKLYTWNDVYIIAGQFPSTDFNLYDKERKLYAKTTDL